MNLQIRTGDGQEIAGLYRWLARDHALSRQATLEIGHAEVAPGQMNSGLLDVINVVLSNGIALMGLVTAIKAYRQTIRQQAPAARRPVVVIIVPAGRFEIEDETDPEQIIKALGALLVASSDEHTR
ncbi:hypothetical protein KBX06_21180 [Micromonospora sp. C31]|uniref:effector-associated constant component EACC1 n=1 Tax=Micromonospora sp. C31 TaxID=2824876 RepID=UPI001B38E973|nr:hypothetical protein [Micromonospora sp. C31]MBQ1075654.1 hypothetical protein [Micromonospora sp. C31]